MDIPQPLPHALLHPTLLTPSPLTSHKALLWDFGLVGAALQPLVMQALK